MKIKLKQKSIFAFDEVASIVGVKSTALLGYAEGGDLRVEYWGPLERDVEYYDCSEGLENAFLIGFAAKYERNAKWIIAPHYLKEMRSSGFAEVRESINGDQIQRIHHSDPPLTIRIEDLAGC